MNTQAKPDSSPLGRPLDRVDGPLKVTGKAQYAGEFNQDGLLYGSVVSSTIARGRVLSIDATAAEAVPGVQLVLTHLNRPRLAADDESYEDMDSADGSAFRPLFNDRVLYSPATGAGSGREPGNRPACGLAGEHRVRRRGAPD